MVFHRSRFVPTYCCCRRRSEFGIHDSGDDLAPTKANIITISTSLTLFNGGPVLGYLCNKGTSNT